MKIIGISGKKQAGKTTVGNFLFGQYLRQNNLVQSFNIHKTTSELILEEDIDHPNCVYSFADELKKFCHDMFNIPPYQLWGTNDQKNEFTQYKWAKMPLPPLFKIEKPEYMTAREFMQVVGTNIFRSIYDNVWVDKLFKEIDLDNPPLAFITDVRYPNEVQAIEARGGIVVRLTRAPFTDDHSGELALDNYDFKYVLDNTNMTVDEQNEQAFYLTREYIYG